MAQAIAVPKEEETVADVIDRAGDAMVMLITRAMWTTLVIQGQAENLTPGGVLDKALREYLEKHGSQEVADYLFTVAEGQRRTE
jgi:hypothetical protein